MRILIASVIALCFCSVADAKTRHPIQPAEQRIACTVLGCQTIPAQCGTTYGRTAKGTPTGYDVIVCPKGIWPL